MSSILNPKAHYALNQAKRIVIKIGSALIMDNGTTRLQQNWLQALGDDIADLKKDGREIIIVSSGAIGLGRGELGLTEGAVSVEQNQAAAATGQVTLAYAWRNALAQYNVQSAQILLTLDDTEQKRRYLNARATLNTLLDLGVVPVINENDTVATDGIRYGDNDRLAARVAGMASADCLILFSDVDGLYRDGDKIGDKDAHIQHVTSLNDDIFSMANNRVGKYSTGGMTTKLEAAQMANNAGIDLILADGRGAHCLTQLYDGTANCTLFSAPHSPRTAHKNWIAGAVQSASAVYIDAGAVDALKNGKSLLPIGVTRIDGTFERGACVGVFTPEGQEIARGLVEHSDDDARDFIGKQSRDIAAKLNYIGRAELIHRDNLVLTGKRDEI